MISVVVALYNVGKYVEKCLESIAEQSFRDFELILVDDGSTDDSVMISKRFLEDRGLEYRIIEKENGGQSSARNCGLRAAKGDHVVFIDSDDVVSRDFLKDLYELSEPDIDFTFCNFKYVKSQVPPEDESKGTIVLDRDGLIDGFLKRTLSFLAVSMLFKRDFLMDNQLYFREDIRFSEDQLFIWECIFKAQKAKYLDRKLYGYYLRERSIMTSSPYEKIVKGYEVYSAFCDELKENYPEYEKKISMILPRWDLGTLYSSARLMDYEEYHKIYEMMDGRSILKKIARINESKAYLLALVSLVSCRMLYALCKRMDLNG